MKHAILIALLAVAWAWASQASAQIPLRYRPVHHGDPVAAVSKSLPWHDNWYYSAEWGIPAALVVPPTAEAQTHYGWGVGNTRVNLIWPRFIAQLFGHEHLRAWAVPAHAALAQ